jgi:dermatan 4-sulfotransferase 1
MLGYKDIRKNFKIPREKPQVWLLEKEKLGYIQIPKNASRSIRLCLIEHLTNHRVMQEAATDKRLKARIEHQHSMHIRVSDIRDKLGSKFFLFGFVRNPLTRILSCYKNKVVDHRNSGKNIFSNHRIDINMDFTGFVDTIVRIPDKHIDRHLRSQSWFLSDKDGLLVNFTGKIENFSEDWEYISSKFGLPEPAHRNKSRDSEKLSAVCSKATVEKLIDRYATDIELFGYQQAVDNILREF